MKKILLFVVLFIFLIVPKNIFAVSPSCTIGTRTLDGFAKTTFKVGETFYFQVNTADSQVGKEYLLTAVSTTGDKTSWKSTVTKGAIGTPGIDLAVQITKSGEYKTLTAKTTDPSGANSDTCSGPSISITSRNPDCTNGAQWTKGVTDSGTAYCCAKWHTDFLLPNKSSWVCDPSSSPYCASQNSTPVPDPKNKDNKVCTEYDSTLKQFNYDFSQINKCDPDKSGNQKIGIQSAIGCIPTGDLPNFLSFVLRWVMGAAGGIILIMLIVTGFNLLTSAGNPEKLQAVKENLVSLFSGIILIVFSLVLLQAVGANILQLSGF